MKRPLIVSKHGNGMSVLMDVHEYEMIQEKTELFDDIQTSLKQLENGQGIDHDQAKQALLARVSY